MSCINTPARPARPLTASPARGSNCLAMPCYFPFLSRDQQTVPCGRCPDCRKKHVNGWVYRMLNHSRKHGFPLFVTLTYDNFHLPVTSRGYLTLSSKHPELFWKALRRRNSKKISYFLCGEYGTQFQRPHYHAIVWGASPGSIIASWPHGAVDISLEPVTERALGYVAGYTLKGHRYTMSKTDDRVPEFARMSKGVGFDYLTQPENLLYHRESLAPFLVLPGGVKVAMPRYYKEFIFNTPELKDAIVDSAAALSRDKGNAAYYDYIRQHGTSDGFIDEQNARRRGAVVQFLSNSKKNRKV